MNFQQFQESIRILKCMGEKDFSECWGESGPYLFEKFHQSFDRRCDDFLCYLDLSNMRAFYNFSLRRQKGA